MRLYLERELELLAMRRRYTQKEIAEAIAVSPSQVSRWHQVPGYDTWMNHELIGMAKRLHPRALVAAAVRCLDHPDVRELEILARLLGIVEAKHPSADGTEPGESDPDVYQIVTLIPRPGMDPERYVGEPLRVPESANR